MKELNVVIPVYNEADAVLDLLDEWEKILDSLDIDYEMNVYNDGSTDNTAKILENRRADRIKIHNKANSGHGATILQGYRENNAAWILQIDSDREIPAHHFKNFWKMREHCDFIIGIRYNRKSPLMRMIMTAVSRIMVRSLFGKGICDVNCPYRMMRAESFCRIFNIIPKKTFAPNILLSGAAVLYQMRIAELPVNFSFRKTGEVSIKKWKLLRVSFISFIQLLKFRLQLF